MNMARLSESQSLRHNRTRDRTGVVRAEGTYVRHASDAFLRFLRMSVTSGKENE